MIPFAWLVVGVLLTFGILTWGVAVVMDMWMYTFQWCEPTIKRLDILTAYLLLAALLLAADVGIYMIWMEFS